MNPQEQPMTQIPVSVSEDDDLTVEEVEALLDEYMMPPAQPTVAS